MTENLAIAVIVCSSIGVLYIIINKYLCPIVNDNESHTYRLNSDYNSSDNIIQEERGISSLTESVSSNA